MSNIVEQMEQELLYLAREIERLQAALDACADYGDKQLAEIERLNNEVLRLLNIIVTMDDKIAALTGGRGQ